MVINGNIFNYIFPKTLHRKGKRKSTVRPILSEQYGSKNNRKRMGRAFLLLLQMRVSQEHAPRIQWNEGCRFYRWQIA